jgi:hypothetical protein
VRLATRPGGSGGLISRRTLSTALREIITSESRRYRETCAKKIDYKTNTKIRKTTLRLITQLARYEYRLMIYASSRSTLPSVDARYGFLFNACKRPNWVKTPNIFHVFVFSWRLTMDGKK